MDDYSLIQAMEVEATRWGVHPRDRRTDLLRRGAARLRRILVELEVERARRDREAREATEVTGGH